MRKTKKKRFVVLLSDDLYDYAEEMSSYMYMPVNEFYSKTRRRGLEECYGERLCWVIRFQ
jgi:hypothetical protein